MTTSNSFIDWKQLHASKTLPTAELHSFIWPRDKISHSKNVCGTTNNFFILKATKINTNNNNNNNGKGKGHPRTGHEGPGGE